MRAEEVSKIIDFCQGNVALVVTLKRDNTTDPLEVELRVKMVFNNIEQKLNFIKKVNKK